MCVVIFSVALTDLFVLRRDFAKQAGGELFSSHLLFTTCFFSQFVSGKYDGIVVPSQ